MKDKDAKLIWETLKQYVEAKESCPKASQDLALNTKNRNATGENHMYGPLNPAMPSEGYWQKIADKWGSSVEEAMNSRCANCAIVFARYIALLGIFKMSNFCC